MEKIEDTARVTPLVVVPRNQLDEVLVEGDTGLGIEDGGVVVTVQIGGDDFVLSVSQYAYIAPLVSWKTREVCVGSYP